MKSFPMVGGAMRVRQVLTTDTSLAAALAACLASIGCSEGPRAADEAGGGSAGSVGDHSQQGSGRDCVADGPSDQCPVGESCIQGVCLLPEGELPCEVSHDSLNGKAAVARAGALTSTASASEGKAPFSWSWQHLTDAKSSEIAAGQGAEATQSVESASEEQAGLYRVTFTDADGKLAICHYELQVPTWTNAKIGGGGFVTGGDVAADGTKVFRNDTSGAYIYHDDTGEFEMIAPAHLDPSLLKAWNGTGSYEALIAESDSSVIYVAYAGMFLRSSDRGKTFTVIREDMQFGSNDGSMRTRQQHGDVDPQNPDHVLLGDEKGLYRSTDGGQTWSEPGGLPTPTSSDVPGYSGVAFNASSKVENGLTSEIIVGTSDKFYRSTDAGKTFSDISAGGPSFQPKSGRFDSAGNYFAMDKALWRYDGSSWKKLVDVGASAGFAIDPEDPDRIVVSRLSLMNFRASDDGGDTWSGANWENFRIESVDDIPWHDHEGYLANNFIVDPVSGEIWASGGNQGIVSAPFDETFESALEGTALVADAHGVGIEQICPNQMVAPPGSDKLHVAFWDEGYGQLDRDNESYPSVMNDIGVFSFSSAIDYSKQEPSYIARAFSWTDKDFPSSGWSDDDGASFTPFESWPFDDNVRGSTLAYSGKDNIIVVFSQTKGGGGKRSPWYTLDRGKTWQQIDLGVPWTEERTSTIHIAHYLNRQILRADPDKLGTFYFYAHSKSDDVLGLWKTSDGGKTWQRQYEGFPPSGIFGSWTWNAQLEVPKSGHVWMTPGIQSPSGQEAQVALLRSFDDGKSFEAVPRLTEVAKFAFGKASPSGSDYPTLFIVGYVDGVPGTYVSPNPDADDPTWIWLDHFARSNHSARSMEADPDVVGRVWVGQACAGASFGDFASLL